jgi:hypothetical protein
MLIVPDIIGALIRGAAKVKGGRGVDIGHGFKGITQLRDS